MKWSRACWPNQRQHLFGPKKDQNYIQRHRLHIQVNIWYNAQRKELLIDRSKLQQRVKILKKNNESIAKWLDSCYVDRDKDVKVAPQRIGQSE